MITGSRTVRGLPHSRVVVDVDRDLSLVGPHSEPTPATSRALGSCAGRDVPARAHFSSLSSSRGLAIAAHAGYDRRVPRSSSAPGGSTPLLPARLRTKARRGSRAGPRHRILPEERAGSPKASEAARQGRPAPRAQRIQEAASQRCRGEPRRNFRPHFGARTPHPPACGRRGQGNGATLIASRPSPARSAPSIQDSGFCRRRRTPPYSCAPIPSRTPERPPNP